MRTTLEIRDELLKEIIKITGEHSKTAALNRAMEEYIALKRKEQLLDLRGRLKLKPVPEDGVGKRK
jgi:hypothetical protein